MKKVASKFSPPYLGAAYYPEVWPAAQVAQDIALMKEAGLNLMRIGEFAWSRMEPEEGIFEFNWLRRVVAMLGDAGIATVMGTPSATPPAWMTAKYPEVMVMSDMGVRAQHGYRRHGCPNSPLYRDFCARIVMRMADEFGGDENVIGWQIDNELSPARPRGCCCPICHEKFQETMEQRFKTIEALNEAWGTHLWSQTYQHFSQLPVPRSTGWHHPSLLTAWMEFQSDSYAEFAAAQADILHEKTTQPVGTDMMPTGRLSYPRTHAKLDMVQFNHYDKPHNLWQAIFWMNYCRGLKERPFWNTETSTCWNGSTAANGYREPGFCRVNSWLPIALGGEMNLYWLWRAHWSGQELMHGSVVSSAGRPLHVFGEVQEIAAGYRKAAEFIAGTRVVPPRTALHFSTTAWYMFEFQPMVNGFVYSDRLLPFVFQPLLQAQLRADVIDPAAPLDGYKLVISPFLPWLGEGRLQERLREWIEAGGTWLVGPMSDVRNEHAAKFTRGPYGCLEEWAGVRCKYEIPADPREFTMQWADGRASQGSVWYDGLELHGAEALAAYADGPFAGLAAVTSRRMGKGRIVALGTLPRPEELQKLALSLARDAGVEPPPEAAPNVVVVPREGKAGRGLFALEIQNQPGSMQLTRPMTDLLTGRHMEGKVEVGPYQVMALVARAT